MITRVFRAANPGVWGVFLAALAGRAARRFLNIPVDARERRRLKESLHRQLELTRTITDNSTQALFMLDGRGCCTFMNPAAEKMFGWTFDELRVARLHGIIHHHRPDGTEYPFRECPIDQALPENFSVRDHEEYYVRKNGEFFPVLVAAAPIFRDGRPVSTVVEIMDVTERKRAEDALRSQSAQLETLIDEAPVGICLIDSDFRIRKINPVALPMTEGIAGGIVGRNLNELVHIVWETGYADEVMQIFRRTLETGESYVAEQRTELRADRRVMEDYQWRVVRITLPDGQRGLVCYFRDISEEVRARIAIAASEERFRALITVITDVVWSSQMGQFVSPQPSWEAYTGQSWEQSQGFGWTDALHPDDRQQATESLERARKSPDLYAIRGRLWHAPTQEYRHVLVRAAAIRNPDNTASEWIGSCTDVEEQTRLAEERQSIIESERAARSAAEHAGRMKDEFLATLSHELRTPLNAILGYAGLMLMKDVDGAEAKDIARTIERNARLQAQMIEDLLDTNRIISGKVRLDLKGIDIRDVIQEAVATIGPAAQDKSIHIELVLDKSATPIRGDPARIQQILWNLLINAVRFTPREGKIHVVLEQLNSHVEIVVMDTGAGIPVDFLPYVFDRFRQADGSTTRRHGGLGLGLAITKQLVELHGGTIQASSPGEGKGASFTVSLPVSAVLPTEDTVEQQAGNDGEISAETCEVDLTGVRVLAVDDEADATHLVKRLLEEYHAEVIEAASAAQALDVLSTTSCDVLVSDIGMPGEDGYQLIRKVRALSNDNRNIPAMALTAFARSEDRRRVALAGFQTHLAKPVEAPELLAIVANLAGRTGPVRFRGTAGG